MNRLLRSVVFAALAAAVPGILGAQWVAQPSGTTAEFRGLAVLDTNVVWASGTRGTVVHTTDGGRTWRVDTIAGAGALDFRAIAAFDDRTAVVMSSGDAAAGQARIYRTSDGGGSWQLVYQTDTPGAFFDAIAFWDAQRGIVQSDPVNGKLLLLTTDDGGRTWTPVPPDGLPPVLAGEAAFAASGSSLKVAGDHLAWIGTGGGATARVFRSSDRGRTWSVAETPVHAGTAAAGIFSVAFRDSLRGIVVGGEYTKPHDALPNVALTDDGGAAWRLARGPLPPGYMSAVSYVPGSAGPSLIAVGLAGTAVSTDGGSTWAMVDSIPSNSVRFVNGGGWTVGPRGRIARWHGAVGMPVTK